MSGFTTVYRTTCNVCKYVLGAYQQTFLLRSLASEHCIRKISMVSQDAQNQSMCHSNTVLNFCSTKLQVAASVYGCMITFQIGQLSNCILGIFHEVYKCFKTTFIVPIMLFCRTIHILAQQPLTAYNVCSWAETVSSHGNNNSSRCEW